MRCRDVITGCWHPQGFRRRKGIIPNGIFDQFSSSWVLLFNDTAWSTSPPTLDDQIQGTFELMGGNGFCCGVADMPDFDLFLISTPFVPPLPYGLISYAGTLIPDVCKVLQKCSLEEFYNVAIGDMICADENCNWKLENGTFAKDFCTYDGVDCDSNEDAIVLDRNSHLHAPSSQLPEEIEYLKFLERLDLGFKPFCAESGVYSCLCLWPSRHRHDLSMYRRKLLRGFVCC